MKKLMPYLTIIVIISLFSLLVWAVVDTGYSTKDEKGQVLCNLMFVYDMNKDPTFDTYQEVEELADKHCIGASKRITEDYRWRSGTNQGEDKHAVLLEDGTCIINWQLTKIGHQVAFNNICRPKEPIVMYDD